jgi:hypothetical protein
VGGEQSAPSEPASTEYPDGEKTESGESPCTFEPWSVGILGHKVQGTGRLKCDGGVPRMLGGTLVLLFSHFQGGPFEYVEGSRISVTSLDIGKQITASTNCKEGFWLVYWEGAGVDKNGHDFVDAHNWPSPAKEIGKCPS